MENFSLLNNIEDPIFVVDSENKLSFQNFASKKVFGVLKDFNKIKKYFHIDVCILDSDNIQNTTLIDLMLESPENFYACCSFQQDRNNYIYFSVFVQKQNNSQIVIFKDISDREKYKKLENDIAKYSAKNKLLEQETKKYVQLEETASDQALKMALLNRISAVIRESTDISDIIKASILEIHNLLGSSKTYYAKTNKREFRIKNIIPEQNSNEISQKISFDEETVKLIKSKQISFRPCIKECQESSTPLSKNTKRIIIPIFNQTELIGVIVSLTTQKSDLKSNIEVIESIATQLSNSIVKASLFKELNKKNLRLQNMLNELKETQLQLINSEKMASLGQLVAGIAHEINTPLASINSNSNLRNKLINSADNLDIKILETARELSSIDQEAIKRINNIVKSLKKFVRLDEAELQEADINREIDLTLQLISHETKNKVEVIKKYSNIPTIKCYPNMLNQVFMNLLMNACQSIPEEQEGKIYIKTKYARGVLTVSIKDDGVGIKKEHKDTVFNPGFTTKDAGIGSGLGLSISHKIIQKHKGKITFKSKEGKGTEFIIKIPAKK